LRGRICPFEAHTNGSHFPGTESFAESAHRLEPIAW
jgi:hypothetical protein